MTVSQRAAQIWSVLALAASHRQILTYDIVGKLIGVPRQGLGRLLEPIQSYCLLNDLPPLSILVVSETSGTPGTGFVAAENIPRKQLEVFAFDWLQRGAPSAEVLEQAVRQRPSNGTSGESETSNRRSMLEYVATLPQGPLLFKTPQDADHWLQEERDSWER